MGKLCAHKKANDGKKGVPKRAEHSLNYVLNVAEQDFHMSISRNWLVFVSIVWAYTYLYIHIHAYTHYTVNSEFMLSPEKRQTYISTLRCTINVIDGLNYGMLPFYFVKIESLQQLLFLNSEIYIFWRRDSLLL